MNQYAQHNTQLKKKINLDGNTGKYIIGDGLSFLGDVKDGGKTILFSIEINTLVVESTNGYNILQARKSDLSLGGALIIGIFRLADETNNESRFGISWRGDPVTTTNVIFAGPSINVGSTYVVAFQTTGSEYKIWINGEYYTISTSLSFGGASANNGSWFGDVSVLTKANISANALGSSSGGLKSTISMMAYWDKLLTHQELLEIYNNRNIRDPRKLYTSLPNLKSLYRFGERESVSGSIANLLDEVVPKNLPSVGITTADIIPSFATYSKLIYYENFNGSNGNGVVTGDSWSNNGSRCVLTFSGTAGSISPSTHNIKYPTISSERDNLSMQCDIYGNNLEVDVIPRLILRGTVNVAGNLMFASIMAASTDQRNYRVLWRDSTGLISIDNISVSIVTYPRCRMNIDRINKILTFSYWDNIDSWQLLHPPQNINIDLSSQTFWPEITGQNSFKGGNAAVTFDNLYVAESYYLTTTPSLL